MEKKESYSFGPFDLDASRRLLTRDSRQVALSGKAFDTLLMLVRNHERLVSKDELIKTVWPDSIVEENNLSQSISAVRKALGDSAQPHQYVETVSGIGYRFAALVIVGKQQDKNSHTSDPNFLPVQKAVGTSGIRKWAGFFAIGILPVIVLAVISYRGFPRRKARTYASELTSQNASVKPRPAVAILGFKNVSGRTEDAWLSTALSEMLLTELSPGETMRFSSGEDVARAKTNLGIEERGTLARDTLQRIRADLGSDLLILGSYALIGDHSQRKIRLDLRVQNTKTGEVFIELAEVGGEDSLFDLVSRVGARLRQSLGTRDLSPTEVFVAKASFPSSSEAAQLYSEALDRLRIFDAVNARNRLSKVTELEPHFPLAHSALADAWSVMGYDGKARDEALQAYRLSKTLSRGEQLLVEGQYRLTIHEWDEAISLYRALFMLFPDDLDYGLKLAGAEISAARASDALSTLKQLRSIPSSKGDPRIDLTESGAWNALGDFKQMESTLQNAVQNAQSRGDRLLLARARKDQCHAWRSLGQHKNAVNACSEAERIYSAAGDRGGQADTLMLLGDATSDSATADAMAFYAQSLAIQRNIGHLSGEAAVLNQIAIAYSDGGDHSAAKRYFEQALSIFRRIGDRVTATGMMINIGSELASEGQLQDARKIYEATIQAAVALGNKDIEALATYDVAAIDQLRGELNRAEEEFQRATTLFEAVQDNSQLTTSFHSLGEIAMSKGDFKNAQQFFESALNIRRSTSQLVPIAESQLDLATLAVESGDTTSAVEDSVRHAVEVFRTGNAANDHAVATALLARILLTQGKESDARELAEQAVAVSPHADAHIRLAVAVTADRVRAGADKLYALRAITNLKKIIVEAHRLNYLEIELQARLALGQLELHSGAVARGRSCLREVHKEAQQRGFTYLANKASVDPG